MRCLTVLGLLLSTTAAAGNPGCSLEHVDHIDAVSVAMGDVTINGVTHRAAGHKRAALVRDLRDCGLYESADVLEQWRKQVRRTNLSALISVALWPAVPVPIYHLTKAQKYRIDLERTLLTERPVVTVEPRVVPPATPAAPVPEVAQQPVTTPLPATAPLPATTPLPETTRRSSLTAEQRARTCLTVNVDRPITVLVDGVMSDFEEGSSTTKMCGLDAGRHHVEFRNLFMKRVDEAYLDFPGDGPSHVRATWRQHTFSVYEVLALPAEEVPLPATVAVAAPDPAPMVAVAVPGFQMTASIAEPVEVQAPVVGPRTVTLRGLDDEWFHVYVDGRLVFDKGSFEREQSITLSPGRHKVVIKDFQDTQTFGSHWLMVDGTSDLAVGFDERTFEVYGAQ